MHNQYPARVAASFALGAPAVMFNYTPLFSRTFYERTRACDTLTRPRALFLMITTTLCNSFSRARPNQISCAERFFYKRACETLAKVLASGHYPQREMRGGRIKNLTEIPGALVLRCGNSIKHNCILEDELKCLRSRPFLAAVINENSRSGATLLQRSNKFKAN